MAKEELVSYPIKAASKIKMITDLKEENELRAKMGIKPRKY
jgi:hypothetical protein